MCYVPERIVRPSQARQCQNYISQVLYRVCLNMPWHTKWVACALTYLTEKRTLWTKQITTQFFFIEYLTRNEICIYGNELKHGIIYLQKNWVINYLTFRINKILVKCKLTVIICFAYENTEKTAFQNRIHQQNSRNFSLLPNLAIEKWQVFFIVFGINDFGLCSTHHTRVDLYFLPLHCISLVGINVCNKRVLKLF